MVLKKILGATFTALCFVMAANSGLRITDKHTIKIPENLLVESVSGIVHNNTFIIAFCVEKTDDAVSIGGCRHFMQCIYIIKGTPGNWEEPFSVVTPKDVGLSYRCSFSHLVLYQANDKIYLFFQVAGLNQGYVKILSDTQQQDKLVKFPEGIGSIDKCKPLLSEDGNDLICVAVQRDSVSGRNQFLVEILRDFKNDESFKHRESWTNQSHVGEYQPVLWQNSSNPRIIHFLGHNGANNPERYPKDIDLMYTNSPDCGKNWENAKFSKPATFFDTMDIVAVKNRVFCITGSTPFHNCPISISEFFGDTPLEEYWLCAKIEDGASKACFFDPSFIVIKMITYIYCM